MMNHDALDIDRMQQAIRQAAVAYEADEVPVGAVIYQGNKLIGKAYNQREMLSDPTAHAEMIAITQAAAELESWRLEGCTLYVTLEPCSMCAGAIVLARIDRVVFGAWNPKAGACGSVLDVTGCDALNHRPEMVGGVLAEECGMLLKEYFREKRARRNADGSPPSLPLS